MMQRMSRREVIRRGGLLVGAGILAGCAPKTVEVTKIVTETQVVKEVVKETVIVEGTPQVVEKEVTRIVVPTAASETPVVIQFARHGDETTIKSENGIGALFTERNPNIKVQAYILNYADFGAKIPVMVAGGVAPDVIGCFPELFVNLWEAKGILVLDDWIAATPNVNFDDFVQPGDMKMEDKIVALPYQSGAHMHAYNADLFEQEGLPTPGELYWQDKEKGWTFEAYMAAGPKLTKTLDDGTPQYLGGIWNRILTYIALLSNGGSIWDFPPTHCTLGTPEAKEALTFVRDAAFVNEFCPPAETAGQETGISFKTGRIAVDHGATWGLGTVLEPGKERPFKWDFCVEPVGKAGARSHAEGNPMIVWNGSKNRDAALAYLLYRSSSEMFEDSYAKGIVMVYQGMPTRFSTFKSKAVTDPLAGLDLNMIMEAFRVTTPQPIVPYEKHVGRIYSEIWPRHLDNMLRGQTVDEMVDACCAEMDEYFKS
jgi:ABC-type glycerol-3-phosphate transport system substrate-binding protein